MITTALGSQPIQSPFVGAAPQRRLAAEPAPPLDSATLSGAVAEPASRTGGRTWKGIAFAALLAAPLVTGALSVAHAEQFDFPVSTSRTCTLPQNDAATITGNPVSPDLQGAQAEFARTHGDSFAAQSALLQKQGTFLERFAARGNGVFKDGSCTVTVQKDAGGLRVQMDDTDHGGVLTVRNGVRELTILQGDIEQSMRETPTQRQTVQGEVTRTLHLAGDHKGDFQIDIPGAHHVTVHGTSITDHE